MKDDNDCDLAGSSLLIDDPVGVGITLIGFTNPTCPGVDDGSIAITASGGIEPYEYSTDNGTTWQSGNSFTSLLAGSYLVWVKDDNGCLDEFDQNPVNLVAGAGVVIGNIYRTNECMIEIDATGSATPFEYSIDGGTTFQAENLFSDLLSMTYTVVVKDANGCEDTEEVEVTCPLGACVVYEAITPNGDGYNDVWDLEECREIYPEMVVQIFSTWGNLVFESPGGYPEPWDGTKDGTELPAGTYFYVIDKGEGSDPVSGTVNIIK